jgi:hypothetical protein
MFTVGEGITGAPKRRLLSIAVKDESSCLEICVGALTANEIRQKVVVMLLLEGSPLPNRSTLWINLSVRLFY